MSIYGNLIKLIVILHLLCHVISANDILFPAFIKKIVKVYFPFLKPLCIV